MGNFKGLDLPRHVMKDDLHYSVFSLGFLHQRQKKPELIFQTFRAGLPHCFKLSVLEYYLFHNFSPLKSVELELKHNLPLSKKKKNINAISQWVCPLKRIMFYIERFLA